jgi:GxxExxY protein
MTPKQLSPDFIFKDECYAIVGACFEVYKDKRCGFCEPCTRNVLASNSSTAEFRQSRRRDCRWNIEAEFSTRNTSPILSAITKIILELKAVTELTDEHRAQVLNYLKAGRFELGLRVNFGHYPKLQCERIAKTRPKPESDETISP